MSYRFEADFSFSDERGKPYDLLLEQNSDFDHRHSVVKNGEYHVLIPGNKHLARTPSVKNFKTRFKLKIDTPRFDDSCKFFEYGFRFFFRYDRHLKDGYLLEGLVSDKSILSNLFSINSRNQRTVLEKTEIPIPAGFNRSRLNCVVDVKENRIGISLNGVGVEITDAKNSFPRAGMIGLDRGFYHGELTVEKWSMSSAEKMARSRIAGPLTIEIPRDHGMSVAYRYVLNLFQYENGPYALDIKLSGGIKDRPERVKGGHAWCHEMDRLTSPYVRLDSPAGECRNIILRRGAMTLLDPEEKRPWLPRLYEDIPWPLKRTVCLDSLPDPDSLAFAAGYEFFENDPMNFLAGGPLEVLCDSRGRVLYHGPSVRRGKIAVSVKSPEDKLICLRIPEDIPGREQALVHARRNHYFFEKEKIRFSLHAQYQSELFFSWEFQLSARVENVYGDSVGKEIRLSAVAEGAGPENLLKEKLDIAGRLWNVEMDGCLDTGVYHLVVTVLLGNRRVYDHTVVFEILSEAPDAPPPPIASGLPMLFSDTSEIQYLERNAFDPWSEMAGAMHYYSICYFPIPAYARKKQIWKLLKVYHRKWLLSITERTVGGDLSVEKNADIIEQCDFLQIPFEGTRTGRYDLWKFDTYRNEVLEILADFLRLNPEDAGNLKVLSPALVDQVKVRKTYLPEEALMDLVDHCWQKWLAYFSGRLAEIYRTQHDKIKKINSRIGRSAGGPFPLYASHHKSAYFMSYYGHHPLGGTEKYCDGFWQFEDYPYSCGYPNTRAIFPMLTLKLHYSRWRLFPEVYADLWDGCNDGAVSQAHPPYGLYELPDATIKLRIYEYAFSVVWFKEGKFHFWNDYGFQFRNHRKEHFAVLLSAWRNVLKHQPVRPVRTTCFLHDLDLIAAHPDHYEKNCNIHTPWKDVFNTAEEALAYSYEAARNAGLSAGFAVSLEGLKSLSSEHMDLLVIPPLPQGLTREHLDAIRELHRQGVNLIGFETVPGLEDLFGVKVRDAAVPIRKIGFALEYSARVGGPAAECDEHELCRSRYESAGAASILLGAETAVGRLEIPVLLTHETPWGRTAFFNLPPTVVNREAMVEKVGYGQECISAVIRDSFRYLLRRLSRPGVSAAEAKVIAFHDAVGDLVTVVEDDSPIYGDDAEYPRAILLRMELPGIENRFIECDRDYSVAHQEPGRLVIRLFLGKYESAVFTFKEGL